MSTTQVSASQFKNICFVGLNKVALYTDSGEVLTGDSWMELTDEQSRRNMALAFFSPRDLHGEPMEPSLALFPEEDEDSLTNLQHLKNLALFDLCRALPAEPNHVNIILVADIIFHWDSQDNYIQPTTEETWQEDLKSVLAGYPRTTEKHIFTDWSLPPEVEADGVHTAPLKNIPLDTNMWVNQPTFQEKYGIYALLIGVIFTIFTYFGLSYQTDLTTQVNTKTRNLQAATRLYANYAALETKVAAIEGYNNYNALFPIIFKDISLAITDNNITPESFHLEATGKKTVPESLLFRLRLKKEVAPTFAEQEPLAKRLLASSLALQKIRKPSTPDGSNTFELEGLVPINKFAELYQKHKKAQDSQKEKK